MIKDSSALKTIGEVSKSLKIPQHVIRFWEKKFSEISPIKKNKGRRYYSISDIETINQIKSLLYEKHYSIKGAQKVILEMRKNTDIKNNADIELFSLIEDLKKVRSKIKDLLQNGA